MTTELHAIKEAVKIICKNAVNLKIQKFLIVTDSMSGVQALTNTKDPDNKSCVFEIHRRLELLEQKGQTTGTIMWCPSHIGIPGNEMADKLAGDAMNLELEILDTPASNSSIKSEIKMTVKSKWVDKCNVSDYFKIVSPKLKPYQIPQSTRHVQVQIMKLRHNSFKYCPYRCNKICKYCDLPFNSGHYLISCPATRALTLGIRSLLKEHQHAEAEEIQAAFILRRLSVSPSVQFLELLKKKPPESYCPEHPYNYTIKLPLP